MILYRWQGTAANFGDELNTILWPRLLPDFFDQDQAVRFLGIGSVLDQRHPLQSVKLVAGSGYGGYEPKPKLDKNWLIHWVRGPRTAATLGLPSNLALGDPAILVPSALALATAGRTETGSPDIGFMPHFESAARGAWRQAASLAGVRLIDPRDPPLDILAAIGRCRLLLSEALHGVIVADAMRVPWVAIRPLVREHRAKWLDWADAMDLRPGFRGLPASTLSEWLAASQLRSWHAGRLWLTRHNRALPPMASERLVTRAASALRLAAGSAAQLSTETAFDRCQSRMLDAVNRIRSQPLPVPCSAAIAMRERSRLQACGDSAYQLGLTG